MDIDFNSIDFAKNPNITLAYLREQRGLYPYELPDGTKTWLITRRNEIDFVLKKTNVFKVSSIDKKDYNKNPFSKSIPSPSHLLATDGDYHKRLRAPLETFFTKDLLDSYRDYIKEEVRSILKNLKSGDQYDLVSEFSYKLPVKVISKMLGLDWDEQLPEYAIALQMVKENSEFLPKVTDFHQILRNTISNKKLNKDSSKNIISELISAGLTDEEVLSMSLLLFIAGSGTTASLISLGIRKIFNENIQNVDFKNLVDEILFITPPANSAFPRYVHEDIIIDGTQLKKGDLCFVILTSANYDYEKEDPLKVYYSFSKGIHHCIGWYVAKIQAEIAYEEFYLNFPKTTIIEEKWISNIVSRNIERLLVKL